MNANTRTAELDLTADTVIAGAEAMVQELVERQAEAEERSYYAEDIHERFARNGFYRILVPRRYGGLELGPETFLRVAMTLLRGCPSTGWCFTLGSSHVMNVASFYEEAAQRQIFGPDGHFVCASRGTTV